MALSAPECSLQLEKGKRGIALPPETFGYGAPSQKVWLGDLYCTGSESRLEECANAGWGVTVCGHRNDVGVRCITEKPGEIRQCFAMQTRPCGPKAVAVFACDSMDLVQ